MDKKIIIVLLLMIMNGITLLGYDKGKISLGGMFVTNFETEMQYSRKNVSIGARINTVDQLGMKYGTGSFRVDGYYRFNDTHSVQFAYYGVKSDGIKQISEDITWGDDGKHVIKAGAQMTSYFNLDIYKLSYGYSFYHNEDVELMLNVGLHVTGVETGISASGTIEDENGTVVGSAYTSDVAVTLPLPVLGFTGSYAIYPKTLYAFYQAEIFALKFQQFSGAFVRNQIGVEYRYNEHIGVALSYEGNTLFVEAEDDENILTVENRLAGFVVNVGYRF